MIASIVASLGPAAPSSGAAAPPRPEVAGPAVRLDIHGDRPRERIELLRGATAVRVLELGGCLTTGAADVVVDITVGPHEINLEITDGSTVNGHTVRGSGAIAALEAVHRVESGIRTAAPSVVHGPACREAAIGVRTQGHRDTKWARRWVAGLARSGRSLTAAHDHGPMQVCLRRDAETLIVGYGPDCGDEVRIPVAGGQPITDESTDQAVGAALALTREPNEPAVPVEPSPPQPTPPDDRPAIVAPQPEVPESEPPRPERPPPAMLHALAAGGPSFRRGRVDPVALVSVGVEFAPGIFAAADVAVIPARLRRGVVAVDTDAAVSLGYKLPLSGRWSLRFAGAGGARMHTYKFERGRTRLGDTTWLAAAALASSVRIGAGLGLELGVRQHFVGRGWLHEVDGVSAGERGTSTTVVYAGVRWIGRRQ
ncbi:MAG: hypothetical protein ACRBN8_14595 [Nannocystales bacterium]